MGDFLDSAVTLQRIADFKGAHHLYRTFVLFHRYREGDIGNAVFGVLCVA
jgi:hypothetical protein